MGGQEQNQTVDPAIQQITEFVTSSINNGDDPVEIVMGLVNEQVDQQIIAQAFMSVGYQQEDLIALFEQVQKQSQPPPPASPQEQNKNPQEIARNEKLGVEEQEAEAQQEQAMVSQQDAMSQNLTAKSGIEIKPENKGKFTRWAKARGMSVQEAARKVMSNPDAYSTSVVKMANFAKNAAGWNKKEGGEFMPHVMHKAGKSRKADTYDQHLKLKEMGYIHKAADGSELTEGQNFFNTTGVVKRDDTLTMAPKYENPAAFNTNSNFSVGDAAAVLKEGYNTFLGDDGLISNRKENKAKRKAEKGEYYNYEVTVDPNDPNTYAADSLDLFNASKNRGELRDLQTFTDDVNENSRANYNVETGEYDALMSSRPLSKDIYGEKKGFLGIGKREANSTYEFGEDLNYFGDSPYVDDDTRDLILGTQDDPEGTTLGINEQGQASSYAPGADNPYEYDTMMGYNTVADDSQPPVPQQNVQDKLDQLSMIPTGSNGQPEPAMYRDYQDNPIDRIMDFNQNPYNPDTDTDGIPNTVDRMGSAPMEGGPTSTQSGPRTQDTETTERPSFRSWYAQNASNFQGKSQSEIQQIYNSIGDNEFRYGGALPKAQEAGEPGPVSSALNSLKSGVSNAWNFYNDDVRPVLKVVGADPMTNLSNLIDGVSIPGALVAEAGESWTGRGDGEFNFTDAIPRFGGDFSFENMNNSEMKNLAALEDAEGNPMVDNWLGALALNIFTDPSSYVGAGIVKNFAKKGIKEGAEQISKQGVKTLAPGKYGGGLPKAQGGGGDFEEMFPDPFNVGNNNQNVEGPINPATGEPWEQPQQSTEQYPDLEGIQDIELPEDIVYDPTPKGNGINNASGMFNVSGNNLDDLNNFTFDPEPIDMVPLEMQGTSDINVRPEQNLMIAPEPPSFDPPEVKRKNKLSGAVNRIKDRLEPLGKAAEWGVRAAGVVNNVFADRRVDKAVADNRENLLADNAYGVNEDPFMKRGTWDVNTGTFGSEGQRTVQTNMGIAKQGGETANVDSIILAKLIAAGADIEIL